MVFERYALENLPGLNMHPAYLLIWDDAALLLQIAAALLAAIDAAMETDEGRPIAARE